MNAISLSTFVGGNPGDLITVSGHTLPGDGGGGTFVWQDMPLPSEDGGMVFGTTASGRWIRQWSGQVNVRWFGARGDGVTDDLPKFNAALAALGTITGRDTRGGGYLLVPDGVYFLSDTIWLRKQIHVVGLSGRSNNAMPTSFIKMSAGKPLYPDGKNAFGPVSMLVFPTGITGIRVALGPFDPQNWEHAQGSSIRNLVLVGAADENPTSVPSIGHGIDVKNNVHIDSCLIHGFSGNGIHIVSLAEPPPTPDGTHYYDLKNPRLGDLYLDNAYYQTDANGVVTIRQIQGITIDSSISDSLIWGSGMNGVYIAGSNAGNIRIAGVQAESNVGYGFFDSERSAANLYMTCHATHNLKGGFYCGNSLYIKTPAKSGPTATPATLALQTRNGDGTYLSCYEEGNANPIKEINGHPSVFFRGRNPHADWASSLYTGAGSRIYNPAIVIGGTLSYVGVITVGEDPDLLLENLTGPAFAGLDLQGVTKLDVGSKSPPAIITPGIDGGYATALMPNGVRAFGAEVSVYDAPIGPLGGISFIKQRISVEMGGDFADTALSFRTHATETSRHKNEVLDFHYCRFEPAFVTPSFPPSRQKPANPYKGWWSWTFKGQDTNPSPLRISTNSAREGRGQLWAENGLFFGNGNQSFELEDNGSQKHKNRVLVRASFGDSPIENSPPSPPLKGWQPGDQLLNTNPIPEDPTFGYAGWIYIGEEVGWRPFGKIEKPPQL